MTRTKEERQRFIKPFQLNPQDTGSVEVQVALLTDRILSLTEHFKVHNKDFSLKSGLLKLGISSPYPVGILRTKRC